MLKDTPTKERGEGPVFFPVEVHLLYKQNVKTNFNRIYPNSKVDTDKLLDWKEKLSLKDEQNNNHLERAALVNVNNTDIALFKYGETIIGKCVT